MVLWFYVRRSTRRLTGSGCDFKASQKTGPRFKASSDRLGIESLYKYSDSADYRIRVYFRILCYSGCVLLKNCLSIMGPNLADLVKQKHKKIY